MKTRNMLATIAVALGATLVMGWLCHRACGDVAPAAFLSAPYFALCVIAVLMRVRGSDGICGLAVTVPLALMGCLFFAIILWPIAQARARGGEREGGNCGPPVEVLGMGLILICQVVGVLTLLASWGIPELIKMVSEPARGGRQPLGRDNNHTRASRRENAEAVTAFASASQVQAQRPRSTAVRRGGESTISDQRRPRRGQPR